MTTCNKIYDTPGRDAWCCGKLDYTKQAIWMLLLKYLDNLAFQNEKQLYP